MAVPIEDDIIPITEEDISNAEARIGRELPQDYHRFLLHHNAGRPQQPCYFEMHVPDDRPDNRGTVARFLGISSNERENLESNLKMYADRMPTNLLPIAYDPGGNLIALATGGKDKGSVYFWDHEFEADEGEMPSYDNLYFIAHSFKEFLEKLLPG